VGLFFRVWASLFTISEILMLLLILDKRAKILLDKRAKIPTETLLWKSYEKVFVYRCNVITV